MLIVLSIHLRFVRMSGTFLSRRISSASNIFFSHPSQKSGKDGAPKVLIYAIISRTLPERVGHPPTHPPFAKPAKDGAPPFEVSMGHHSFAFFANEWEFSKSLNNLSLHHLLFPPFPKSGKDGAPKVVQSFRVHFPKELTTRPPTLSRISPLTNSKRPSPTELSKREAYLRR